MHVVGDGAAIPRRERVKNIRRKTQQVQVAASGIVSLLQVITAAYGIPNTMARPQGICRKPRPGCAAGTKELVCTAGCVLCCGWPRMFELQLLLAMLPMTKCSHCFFKRFNCFFGSAGC
jgi:hypothetical protein